MSKPIVSYSFTAEIHKLIAEHAKALRVSRSVMVENIVRQSFGLPLLAAGETKEDVDHDNGN